MAKERNGGLMDRVTPEIGNSIKLQAEEFYITLMVMCIKENGRTISPMEMVNINIRMELYIKANGRMISSTVKAYKYGQTDKNTKDIFKWVQSPVTVY